ncbi:Serine-threonine kinase receptor-associated protein [Cladobotryum mycophilum]|uniref:Serine-threonine kinase receptor-associated protein n=1 Tax=Cladobotryum mycophilum TaxID=491253 RepID=A0ABR0T5L4_9HYPO
MAAESPRQYVPLTCHGHSRPVPHISFSYLEKEETYYMISACKDGNPMLRDGVTGDWIGTFIGHKGAVWQARLSPDASNAATAAADFTAKIWDTHTATGGMEKKLRIFDLSDVSNLSGTPTIIPASSGFEIAEGVHTASIKFICWTIDPNIIVTASEKTLRWLDLPSRTCIQQKVLDGEIRACEMVSLASEHAAPTDIGGGMPVLAVSAGKTAYFWGGPRVMDELKRIVLPYSIASVALDLKGRKIVVGEEPGTWAKVIRYDDEVEIETHKGHHGPIWSIAFSPDGKLYATASEDGTIKMWKNCDGFYGLWRGGVERSAE